MFNASKCFRGETPISVPVWGNICRHLPEFSLSHPTQSIFIYVRQCKAVTDLQYAKVFFPYLCFVFSTICGE